MKKMKIGIMAAALFFTGMATSGQEFSIETDKTTVIWEGKGVGKSHTGNIAVKEGSISLENQLPVKGKIVIDMTSITNSDLDSDAMKQRLVGHLASDDFFGVDNYPVATFKILSSAKQDIGTVLVKGDLTIKGKTHPVEFVSEVSVAGKTVLFKGIIEVDRSLYDVKYGSGKFFDNLGDRAINDIFTLNFELLAEIKE